MKMVGLILLLISEFVLFLKFYKQANSHTDHQMVNFKQNVTFELLIKYP